MLYLDISSCICFRNSCLEPMLPRSKIASDAGAFRSITSRPLVLAPSPSTFFRAWSRDGLAALVISPTRELSLQIFEVLREFGKHHQLSAGLITGGKKEFREEQTSVIKMNILVATPGRLLQHLEQTPGFDPSLLQVCRLGRDVLH